MATPLKKRVLNKNSNVNGNQSENSESGDDASEGNDVEEYIGQEVIIWFDKYGMPCGLTNGDCILGCKQMQSHKGGVFDN